MTLTTGSTVGLIATVTSVIVAVVEAVRKIIDMVKERKRENPTPQLPCRGNTIDMVYNDNTGRWITSMPITNMNTNPMRYIGNNTFGGMNKMFEYDVWQGSDLYDTPNTNMYNRNLPYGYGYNPNKPDYIWQDRTLGQVPSTTEYTPFESRTGFDPVPWLKAQNSYVATMDPYYPYRNSNLFIKYDNVDPPKDDSYLKDPNAGILYKDLQKHFQRRDFNPYEPSRPFATYNPNSINANDPAANPYGMTQEQINGMVNRANYYKDLMLNINKSNPFGAPNDIDNPYNLLGGPSYVGPDGNLYIRSVPPQPEYHARREFLASGRTKPYPTLGGEVFGRSMYNGFDFQTMNKPNNSYNTILTGGIQDMYDSRRYGVDPAAPPIMSIPYVQNYIRKQQAEQQQKQMTPINPYADCFSQPTQKPILQSPYVYANPYSRSIQNQIDRSQLMIDPTCGMDLNDGDPNDKLAMLLQLQPNGGNMSPQQEMRNQMIMNSMYGNNRNSDPYANTSSILGPNTHAGMMRQSMNNYGANQAGTYIPNASVYGMQQQMQMMRQGMNNGSVFCDNRAGMMMNQQQNIAQNIQNMNANMNYGMSQPQNVQQQPQQNMNYGMNVPQQQNMNTNVGMMNMPQQNTQQPSINSIFGDNSGQTSQVATATPDKDVYDGMTNEQLIAYMQGIQNGDIETTKSPEIRQATNAKSPDELARKLFDI